ncbi:FAD-dependent oxidoreductase [Brevundimonas sp. AJA228-03]|uniref:flavin monoamine oxidase family protein n=1 Tax=Brevundimonas sp. AJA228-03 TaxID=2752515 RepID=UPI001ADF25D8|nr:NAD(P)/FAD-dependent oxidoreductase [Brevundimonas sp. AJA228-03]QTN19284.1 FAD-dependent oxidoreductase [Brevundimonas sp. AJA228-03]
MLDAIIIGGGLAGLAAARHLKRRGASLRVLEARDRIGGRVQSQRLTSGHFIDLGAQLIGDAQTRISALVDEVGLTRVARNHMGQTVHIPSPDAEPVLARSGSPPLSLIGKVDALQALWDFDGRLKSFRADIDQLDAMTAAHFIADMTFTRATAALLAGFTEGELCVPLDDVSAYELLDQSASVGGYDGERASADWYLAEGMAPVADHLASALGGDLILNAAVTEIEQHTEWFRVSARPGTYRARNLVVAVPPQLYEQLGLFPLLPAERRKVLATYRHGEVIKTILVFERPWWRDRGLSGDVLSPGSMFNSALDGSPENGGVGILVLFATAAAARRLSQTRAESDRISKAIDWLRGLSGWPVPNPIAARSIDWNADPWSLGGYASRRPIGGWSETPDLFASSQRIHFAGSETANEWRSFMEGALQSAERAADDVLRDLSTL